MKNNKQYTWTRPCAICGSERIQWSQVDNGELCIDCGAIYREVPGKYDDDRGETVRLMTAPKGWFKSLASLQRKIDA